MSNELAVIERDEPEPSPDALGIHPAWRLSPVDRWEIEHGRVTFYAVVDPRVLRASQRKEEATSDGQCH